MFTYSTKFSILLMKKTKQVGYIFVQVIYSSVSFQLVIDSSSIILNKMCIACTKAKLTPYFLTVQRKNNSNWALWRLISFRSWAGRPVVNIVFSKNLQSRGFLFLKFFWYRNTSLILFGVSLLAPFLPF